MQTLSSLTALSYLAMGAVVAGNVLGNVFLKLGSVAVPHRESIFGVFVWQTAAGIGFFASAVLLYAWVLRNLPLHIAQGVASLQFVGAVLAAAFIFGEPINYQNWFGIGLICIGLMFVTG